MSTTIRYSAINLSDAFSWNYYWILSWLCSTRTTTCFYPSCCALLKTRLSYNYYKILSDQWSAMLHWSLRASKWPVERYAHWSLRIKVLLFLSNNTNKNLTFRIRTWYYHVLCVVNYGKKYLWDSSNFSYKINFKKYKIDGYQKQFFAVFW